MMRVIRGGCGMLGMLFAGALAAQTAAPAAMPALPAAEPALVEQLQQLRQRLPQDRKIDVPQMSRDILATVKDAEALDRSGNDAAALQRLLSLQKYAPLAQLPSYDVQMLCSWLYGRLGQAPAANDCRRRAAAMRVILHQRSGSGRTPDDPVRVVMDSDMVEWLRSSLAKVTGVRAYRYRDAELQQVTYVGPIGGGQPTVVYFALDPRVQAAAAKEAPPDIFAPLPLDAGDAEHRQAVQQAHAQRERFLADKSFRYLALIQLSRDAQRDAVRLELQGDAAGALAKLREIERVRPIREVPLVSLISTYSTLLGKTGDAAGQADMRMYLFGILQDIAHSGDGLSTKTAIHVIAVAEEYSWLGAKKLHLQRQSLLNDGDRHYDAMDTLDAQGHAQTYYFDVSGFFTREGEG